MTNKRCYRGLLPDRPVQLLLMAVPALSLHLLPSIFKAHETVLIEAFNLAAPVESLAAFIALHPFPGTGNNRKTLDKNGPAFRAQSIQ